MTTITDARVEALRARFSQALSTRLDAHIERLSWDADRLLDHQRRSLRALLRAAIEGSPFHARRLAGIDPEAFELDQLARLPVMSKAQMMGGLDELMTDRRITRAAVEAQLGRCAQEPSLLYDEYVCLASGGSSGLRGIFVQTLGEFADFGGSVLKRAIARARTSGGPPPGGLAIGMVAAASPVHSTGFAAAIARGYPARVVPAPATLAVEQVVQRLNDAQPPVLLAHTTKLVSLAAERRAGRLGISPAAITAMGETVTAEDRAAIEGAFEVPLITQFTSTEGLVGHSAPGEAVINFATDMCLVELVDADNRPVSIGTRSDKVLVTNLHNLTQPLIRYELGDCFTRHPDLPGLPHLRALVEGRADDVFRYGSVAVDPLVIRTIMVRTPAALEYQVRQIERGIDIHVVAGGQLDRARLAAALADALRSAGLDEPVVKIRQVSDIVRHAETGKARRFIPL